MYDPNLIDATLQAHRARTTAAHGRLLPSEAPEVSSTTVARCHGARELRRRERVWAAALHRLAAAV